MMKHFYKKLSGILLFMFIIFTQAACSVKQHEVTLNGIALTDFTIACKAKDEDVAYSIAEKLGQYTESEIPVVNYASLTGDEEGVICVGASKRDGSKLRQYEGYLIKTVSDSGGLTIGIEANGILYPEAQEALFDAIEVSGEGEQVSLTLKEDEITYFTFEEEIPTWKLETEETTIIADGVSYTEQLYYDEEQKPYRTYILTIDPAKAYLYMGTSDDGYNYTLDEAERQTVEEHMKSAAANGLNVIAGVNADFFEINGDYHPIGLAIKEGEQISDMHNSPFLGFTYDGKAIIGTSEADLDGLELRTGVGGSDVILRNGLPTSGADVADHHPRTLAGIKEDGTILLVVIDGRQPEISNDVTLARCALLMRSLGAVDALNLDGGGSSCLITRDGTSYVTHNSPSDGSLRKVYDSLLVVLKD